MAESDTFAAFALRALACRCPRCGKSTIYKSFLGFVDRCASCGLAIGKHDNGDGPAVFLIFILGFVLVPVALFVAMRVDWPLWVHALLWGVVVLGATLGMLRPAKSLTLSLQYRHRKEVFHD